MNLYYLPKQLMRCWFVCLRWLISPLPHSPAQKQITRSPRSPCGDGTPLLASNEDLTVLISRFLVQSIEPARSQHQLALIESKKMGGGMEVNKNKFIEDWNAGRENLEFNFRWTRRNLAIVGIFGVAVPLLLYKGIVREFVRSISIPLLLFSQPTQEKKSKP